MKKTVTILLKDIFQLHSVTFQTYFKKLKEIVHQYMNPPRQKTICYIVGKTINKKQSKDYSYSESTHLSHHSTEIDAHNEIVSKYKATFDPQKSKVHKTYSTDDAKIDYFIVHKTEEF